MDLADVLGFEAREHVAVVGAGGKKTALQHFVEQGGRRTLRVGYTTTTHMPPPGYLDVLIADREEIVEKLPQTEGSLAFAGKHIQDPDRADEKVRGYDTGTIDDIFDTNRFDWLLVKADGARRREFKAPGGDEPVIPTSVTHVLPFASVTAIGNTLDEQTVHRPERVAGITETDVGEEVVPETVATVFASPRGGLKRVPHGATVTPVLNKADTPARRETARHTLELALNRTDRFDRALVTSFRSDYVEVVSI